MNIRSLYAPFLVCALAVSLPVRSASADAPLSLYDDSGVLDGATVFVWGVNATWNGNWEDFFVPEGLEAFETTVPANSFGGWGIFETTNLNCFTNGNLSFWVNSTGALNVEIEGAASGKRTVFIESSGGSWKKYDIPAVAFTGVDFNNMFGLFLVTSVGAGTFYVDLASWQLADPPGTLDPDAIDFSGQAIQSYGVGQDIHSTRFDVLDNGATLRMYGNNWKAVDLPYIASSNTVIEFDFRSLGTKPEINGIGLDEDLADSADRIVQVFGSQTWGIQSHNDYVPYDWKHYVIPVGQSYTGLMRYLSFANDADASQSTVVDYRNVKVYENTVANTAPSVYAGEDDVAALTVHANLGGVVTDDGKPSGTLLTQWSKVSGPGGVTFANSNTIATIASFTAVGTYVLRLTADDGALTGFDEVEITVIPNMPPTVDAGPDVTVSFPDPIPLDGSASDDGLPFGSLLTQWSVISGPGAMSFANSNNAITVANVTTDGVYVVRLTADDGELSTYSDITVTVNPDIFEPIENGETISTSIAFVGDVDEYLFNATTGDVVKVRMARAVSTFRSKVDLIDPFGAIVATGDSWDTAEVTATLAATGPYTLICRENSGRSGNYSLSMLYLNAGKPLSTNDLDLRAIENGEVLSGSISASADLDASTFVGAAGEIVKVRMTRAPSTFYSSVELRDPAGNYVSSAGSWDAAEFTATLPVNGTYTIVCKESSVRSGGYNLSVLWMTADKPLSTNDVDMPALGNGEVISGHITTAADLDRSSFVGAAGDAVKIRMTRNVSTFYSSVELRDPTGAFVTSAGSWDAAEITTTLPTSGEYSIVCKEGSMRSGAYSLSMLWLNPGVPLSTNDMDLPPIENGAVVSGTISAAADIDATTFNGSSGDVVRVRMTRAVGTFLSSIEMRDPGGVLVASGSSWDAAEIVTTLQTNGTYSLVCREGSMRAGPYNLSMLWLNEGVPLSTNDLDLAPIENGEVLSGTISTAADIDASTFAGSAGDVIKIRMTRAVGTFYSSLELRDFKGALVATGGSYDAAEITTTLPTDGTYTIVCREGSMRSGAYNLSMLWLAPSMPLSPSDQHFRPIENGEVLIGNISTAADIDATTFSGNAGERVKVRMARSGGTFYSSVELRDPSGALVASAGSYDAAEFNATLPANGTYSIVCREGSMRSGTYGLSIMWLTPGEALSTNDLNIGAITNGAVLFGSISHPSDLDAASFDGVVGNVVTIRMAKVSGSFYAHFELRDSNGDFVKSAAAWDAATIVATVSNAGTHTIVCREGSMRTGGYTLSLGMGGAVDPDSDGDGMPDAWELLFQPNLTIMGPGTDSDGDGLLDLHEFLAGTDPTDDASKLEAFGAVATGGIVELQWSSTTGTTYKVLRTTDIVVPFSQIAAGLVATPPTNSYLDGTATGPGIYYYRVQVE